MTKKCRSCGKDKHLSEYWRDRKGMHGVKGSCKECQAKQRKTRDSYINHRKAADLRRYGITLDDYRQLQRGQRGTCAICSRERCLDGRNLMVDHCHTSGRVRGLLCNRCNLMLGKAEDDRSLLRRAIRYLENGGSGVLHRVIQPGLASVITGPLPRIGSAA